jgi:hypothetical protein
MSWTALVPGLLPVTGILLMIVWLDCSLPGFRASFSVAVPLLARRARKFDGEAP